MKKIKFFCLFIEQPATYGFIGFAIVVGGIGLPLMGARQAVIDLLYYSGYVASCLIFFFSLMYQIYKFRKTGTFGYGLFGDPDQTSPF